MGNTVVLQESQWCKIENWVVQKRVVGVGTLAACACAVRCCLHSSGYILGNVLVRW
jgi:hypothetical protein